METLGLRCGPTWIQERSKGAQNKIVSEKGCMGEKFPIHAQ